MSEINLIDFYNLFKDYIEENTSLINAYQNRGGITGKIITLIKEILEKKYKYRIYNKKEDIKDNRFTQKEYFRIDLIGWTQKKYEEEVGKIFDDERIITDVKIEKNYRKNKLGRKEFNIHWWDMDIAIEHENAFDDWMDEVIKLCYINCPLRIVIGYVDREQDDDFSADERILKAVVKSIDKLDRNGKKALIKTGDEFGIILGSKNWSEESLVSIKENYQLYRVGHTENGGYKLYKYTKEVEEEIKIDDEK